MAIRETQKPGQDNYRPGDYLMICDECGLVYRRLEMRERWDKAWVCPKDWEIRNPQDYVRGRKEKIKVDVARPDPEPVFITAGDVTQDDL